MGNAHTKKTAAFTLIELLVVIAVIAVLAGMLLPTLARAKEQSKRTKCFSTLKNWGQACAMYVDDNSGWYPDDKIPAGTQGAPPGYNEDNPTWDDLADFYYQTPPQGMDAWFNALPPYVMNKPLYIYAIQNGSTGKDSYNAFGNIFSCPSAVIDPAINPDERVCLQYGMNSKALWDVTGAVLLKANMIFRPSAFVVFSEGRTLTTETPFYGSQSKETDICKPNVYTTDFSSRHLAGADILFSDAHVGWYAYSYVCSNDVVDLKAADPGHGDINWAADGTKVP